MQLQSVYTYPLCRAAKRLAAAVALMLGCAGLGAQTPTAIDICDRTDAVETAILAATNTVGDACTSVLETDLAAITELDLTSSGITSLRPGDFSGLSGLRVLDLHDNAISALPDALFSALVSLRDLSLSSNTLSTLPAGVFSGLAGLQTLDLKDNRLGELPAGVFAGLAGLTGVDLSGNPGSPFMLTVTAEFTPAPPPFDFASAMVKLVLREGAPRPITAGFSAPGATLSTDSLTIPTGGVESSAAVTIVRTPGGEPFELTLGALTLGGDNAQYPGIGVVAGPPVAGANCEERTAAVEAAILAVTGTADTCEAARASELAAVTELDLSTAGIRSLRVDDFAGLAGLLELNLRDNALTTLPDEVFSALVSLRDLSLSSNNLSVLSAGVFSESTDLETLDLSENNLERLPSGIFSGLADLETLNLHENNLERLPTGIFAGLTDLMLVRLDENPGSDFMLTVRPKLRLSQLPDGSVSSSARLVLPEGALQSITGFLLAPGASLSGDFLTIPVGGVESGTVTITRAPGSTSVVLTLGELNLAEAGGTYIGVNTVRGETIIDICGRTGAVEAAILAATTADTCETVLLSEFLATTELDLASTGLTSLQASDFVGLAGLQVLNLKQNSLTALPPGVFSDLSGLLSLDLSGNGLIGLRDGVFSRLANLQTLDLRDNQLDALPAGVFAGMTGLTAVDLSGNSEPDFTLTVRPKLEFLQSPDGSVRFSVTLELREGAPRPITADLLPTGAALSAASLTIPTGNVESGTVTMTSIPGAASFTLASGSLTLGGDDADYSGVTIVSGEAVMDVCARTDAVEAAILAATSAGDDTCDAVLVSALTAITELDLVGAGITSLQAGDFAGLIGLRTLNLHDNALSALSAGVFSGVAGLRNLSVSSNRLSILPTGVFSGMTGLRTLDLRNNRLDALPAGVFAGLAGLTGVDLRENPGTPFRFTVRPEFDVSELSVGFSRLSARLVLREGAPRPITVGLSAAGATLSDDSLMIPTGGVESSTFALTRLAGSTSVVLTLGAPTLGGAGGGYLGFNVVVVGEAVVDICARTDAVRNAIVAATAAADCGAVLGSALTAVTELDLSGAGITSLQTDDFAELAGLQSLSVGANQLSVLPTGVFSGLSGLRTLDLRGNQLNALPAGVFAGLVGLTGVDLRENPGTTFTLMVGTAFEFLRLPGDFTRAAVKLTLSEGAPRSITVALSTDAGAALSLSSLTIPTGGVESGTVTITRVSESVPFRLTLGALTLEGADARYPGIEIVAGPPVEEATINVCARTDAVEAAILAATSTTCEAVPVSELAAVTELDLSATGITSLQADDFAMLDGLRTLDLRDNQLDALPAGVFAGLAGLTGVDLQGNPGSTFTLTVGTAFEFLRLPGDFTRAAVKLTLSEGAPRPITVALSTDAGAALSLSSLTIPTGGVESGTVTITRASESVPFRLTLGALTLGGADAQYPGIEIVAGPPVEEATVNVCARTDAVEAAILAATAADACDAVLASALTAITELDLSTAGITSLQAGDFAELTGLRTLDLRDNQLDALPAGVFSGLAGLTGVDLQGNPGSTFTLMVRPELELLQSPDGLIRFSVKLRLLEGAPRRITAELLPTGATLSADSLAIPTGGVESSTVTMTLIPGSASFGLALAALRLGGSDGDYGGLDILAGGATIDVCARTDAVRTAILAATPAGDDVCEAVLVSALSATTELNLAATGITSLQAGDFVGLTGLRTLDLRDNLLTGLPAGIFAGLTSLEGVRLSGNSALSFELVVRPEFTPVLLPDDFTSATVKLVLREAAPRPITVGLLVAGATISVGSLTIPTGGVESDFAIVTRIPGNVPFRLVLDPVTLGGSDDNYDGLSIVAGESVLNICDRTDAVQAGILAVVPTAGACETVLVSELMAITELDLSATEITSLQAGDFAALIGLQILNLADNDLNELPAGVFSKLTNLAELRLDGNPGAPFKLVVRWEFAPVLLSDDFTRATMRLVLREGAPRSIVSDISATGAMLSADSLTIPAGGGESNPVIITRIPGDVAFELFLDSLTLGGDDDRYTGFDIEIGEPLIDVCDRTEAVQTAILEETPAGDTCEAVLLSALVATTELNLAAIGLASLQTDDFAGLIDLQTLDLSGNLLTGLPGDVFSELDNLRALSLNANGLSALPPGVFSDLINLRTLSLSANGLSALPPGVFSGLVNLRTLSLSANGLSELPPGVFSDLPGLQTLDLSDNLLTGLPEELFSALISLRDLSLSSNRLSVLPTGVFAGSTGLQTLDLSDNLLTSLSDEIFSTLTSLQDLSLSSNRLSVLPPRIFAGATGLQALDLRNNGLGALPAGVFLGLGGLMEVRLDANPGEPFELVARPVFDPVLLPHDFTAAAVKLVLSEGAPRAVTVDISAAGATLSPGSLIIPTGEVESGVATIARASNDVPFELILEALRFGGVDGRYTGFEIVAGAALIDVCARTDAVRIAILGETSAGACDVVLLTELTAITELNLAGAGITSLQAGDFAGLSNLRTLRLDDNDLTALPEGIFEGLSGLQTLRLDDNDLTALPEGVFSPLSNLQTLRLDDNVLTALPAGVFSPLSNLQTLRLDDNRLITLPEGIFEGLSGLQEMHLGDNPDSPFTFTLRPKLRLLQSSGGIVSFSIQLALREGAPRTITADFSAGGATLSADSLTIPAGGVESGLVTMTLAPGAASFSLVLESLAFSGFGGDYNGLNIVSGGVVMDVCARTEAVRTAILAATAADACEAVLVSALAAIAELNLADAGIRSLQPGDFSGLAGLSMLDLSGNNLDELPAGVFARLAGLREVYLGGNPGSTFTLTVRPEFDVSRLSDESAGFSARLVLREGAPRPITVRLSAVGATLSPDLLTIPTGGVESGSFAVTRTPGSTSVVLTLGAPALGGPDARYAGFRITSGEALIDVCARTAAIRDAILSATSAGACDAVPVSALKEITRLSFTFSRSLEPLQEDDFAGLSGLRDLALDYNNLTGLPEGVFSGLISLRILELNNNNLTSLPAGVFSGLISLRGLRLIDNSLTALPAAVFSGLANLRWLDLAANDLAELPADVFSELTGLQRLDLENNDLTELPADAFSGLTSLQQLLLFNNDLTELPAGVFSGLTSLQRLLLFNNDLTELPADIFSGLDDLRELRLEYNELAALPTGVFSGLDKLEKLLLEHNELAALPTGVFSGLDKLQELRLNHNLLTGLPEGVFSGLTSLTKLFLDANPSPEFGINALFFTFTVRPKLEFLHTPDGHVAFSVRLELRDGAPRSVTAALSAAGAALSAELLTIPTGGVESSSVTMTLTPGDASFGLTLGPLTLGGRDRDYGYSHIRGGFNIVGGEAVMDVCARTDAVRAEILTATAADACDAVPVSALTAITELDFTSSGITSLLPGDFAGLAGLQTLNLADNGLDELPVGVFAGLTGLGEVRLSGNPGSTFTLTVRPEFEPVLLPDDFTDTTVKLVLRRGAPRPITVSLSARGATVSPDSLTIPTGGVESSGVVTITRTFDGDPFSLVLAPLTFGGSDDDYAGLDIVAGDAAIDICARTDAVQAAILAAAAADTCEAVPVSALTAITELDLTSSGIRSLRADDFAGLMSLQTLILTDNGLTELPEGVFSVLPGLRTLLLGGNDLAELPENIFSGLTQLMEVRLDDNRGAPFEFVVRPEFEPALLPDDFTHATVKLVLREGAPRPITVSLSAIGATLSPDSLTIPAGGVESGVAAIARTAGAVPFELIVERITFGGSDGGYAGFEVVTGEAFIDVCARTDAVQAAILAATAADACETVPVSALMAITELNLTSSGVTSLRADDFAGLTGLRELLLGDNDLTGLPERIFSGLDGLQRLLLSGNELTELPQGVFSGLTDLTEVRLAGNRRSTFTLTVRPRFEPALLPHDFTSATMRLVLLEGAPRAVTVNLLAAGATLSSDSLMIPTGGVESGAVEITRRPGDVPFRLLTFGSPSLGGADGDYDGFDVVIGEALIDVCARTAAVQTAILAAVATSGTCDAVLASELAAITELDMIFAGITSLQADDFAGLSGLQTLLLRFNDLAALPEGVFSGLTRLQTLELGFNDLTELAVNVFSGLDGLRTLSLHSNNLNVVPERIFSELPGLQELRLDDNGLDTLPAGVFAGLTNLRVLRLDDNDLSALPEGVFAGLDNLQELRLDDNGLDTLPPGVFAGLTNLRALRLDENDLSTLPASVFLGLSGLQELRLDENDLDTLPAGVFSELSGLQHLRLDANRLTALPESVFSGLTGLQILRLDDNDLAALPAGVFSGLTGLQILRLDDNDLAALPAGVFSGLTGLTSVWLNDNPASPFMLVVNPRIAPLPVPDGLAGFSVKLELREGAPRPITANLSAPGAALSADSLTIPVGSAESATLRMTHAPGAASLELIVERLTFGAADVNYEGLNIVAGEATIDVCARTDAVEAAILAAVPASACETVPVSDLMAITELDLSSSGITFLQVDDFSGLVGLQMLSLENNDLTELPEGVFSGLESLAGVRLDANPDAPFELVVRPEFKPVLLADDFTGAEVKLVLREGAPRRITVSLSANGAELSSNSLTIPTGGVESSAIVTITRTAGDVPFELTFDSLELGGLDGNYGGFDIVAGGAILDICDRTDKVKAAILAATSAEVCEAVLITELTATTELDLAGTGVTSLQPGDFYGLTGLQTLDLRDNGLNGLPAGIFAGLTGLTEMHLSGNPGSPFTLTVRPEFEPVQLPRDFRSATMKLVLSEGAPRRITVGLSVSGAELSTDSLTIPAGGVESSAVVTITRASGNRPFRLTLGTAVLGGSDDDYSGFVIVVPEASIMVGGVRLRLRVFLEGALE